MTTPLTLMWVSDEDGTYVVTVDGATVDSGSCVAGSPVVNVIDEDRFFVGDNPVTVTVANLNGVGFDIVDVARLSGPSAPGVCWDAPVVGEVPRTERDADPLANRMGAHVRGPVQLGNVFILKSGKVIADEWHEPDDEVRVALFGGVHAELSLEDAAVLTAAGYGAQLVPCPQPAGAGWNTAGWNTRGWNT